MKIEEAAKATVSGRDDGGEASPRLRGYVICCTARSGSTFLARLLTSTGRLGVPAEFFHAGGCRFQFTPDYPEEPEQQLAEILRWGATSNGVYGLKVHPDHFDVAKSVRWVERLPELRFISLVRDDMLGQAISRAKAMQTDQWVAAMPAKGVAAYDTKLIASMLRTIALEQARWRFWFARTGIKPLRLRYEQVVENPQAAVDAVAALVGVGGPVPYDPTQLRVSVQRDAETEAWRARFIAESGALSVF